MSIQAKKNDKKTTKSSIGSAKTPKGINYDAISIDAVSSIKEGLPYEHVEELVKAGAFSMDEIIYFIPVRTLARRKQSQKLSPEESDTIARLSLVFAFATKVFGSKDKAKIWLRQANRAMQGHTPLELLSTNYGSRIVENKLGRIEHGVYS